jgi:hypothetical protein
MDGGMINDHVREAAADQQREAAAVQQREAADSVLNMITNEDTCCPERLPRLSNEEWRRLQKKRRMKMKKKRLRAQGA